MRISRHQMFMQIARAVSLRSTCFRLNVGAVFVRDRNIVSIGYNGAPSGQAHCTGNGCAHYKHTGCGVTHAEENALERLNGLPWDELYVTHSPCQRCAHVLWANITSDTEGLHRIYYETEYRDRSPVDWLTERDVQVYRLLPSGYTVNAKTNELVVED